MKIFSSVLLLIISLSVPCFAQTVTIGSPQTVMTNSQSPECCFPDSTIGVALDSGTYYSFAASGYVGSVGHADTVGWTTTNYNTLWSSASRINITGNLPLGGSGAFNQNYVSVGPVLDYPADGILIGIYHGEFWYNAPAIAPFIAGLGLAVSYDLGQTWSGLGQIIAPNILRADCPPNSLDVGIGTLLDPGDGYIYTYFVDSDAGSGCNDAHTAVARASKSALISAALAGGPPSGSLFLKYSSGSFSTAGITDPTMPANGGGASAHIAPFFGYLPDVKWDSAIGRYIMAYTIPWTGIGIAFSTDLVTWNNQRTIFSDGTDPSGSNAYLYTTLINTSGGDPGVLGNSFYLYYDQHFGSWPATVLNRVQITVGGGGGTAASPNFSPSSGAVPQTVTISTSSGSVICYNTTGAPGPISGGTTCPGGSTKYTAPVSVSVAETIYAVAGGPSFGDSSINSATYSAGGGGGPAADLYYTQAGSGTQSGSSCGNGLPISYFNSSGNWGSGASQIGAGTTNHLCGTISTALTAQGSGSSGQPITIKWETGASLTSTAWSEAIVLDNHDNFILDGGSPCGWIAGTSVSCNGTIQNTLNGTSGNTCPGGTCTQHVTGSLAISASPSNGIEVKNLGILNMYMVSGGEDVGGPPGPGCIHFYPTTTLNNWSIHNNVFTWSAWCLNGGANNLVVANNDFHFVDHGIGMGQFTDATANFNGVTFHDNRYHDADVWDSPSNDFHHDGVHLFSYSSTQHTNVNATITNINIYNNLFDGDMGDNNTAMIFFEGQEVGANIFNNVGIVATGRQINNGLYNGYGKNVSVFNNTVIGPACTVSMGICTTTQTQKYSIFNGPGFIVKNNAYTDGGMISVKEPYPFDCPGTTPCQTVGYTLSTNAYIAPGDFANGFGSLISGFYNYNAGGFASFESDTGEAGGIFTDNGVPTSTYFDSLTGKEKAGSPTINSGTNLTSFCTGLAISGNPCLFDIFGAARPSSGAWDVGAFQFAGGLYISQNGTGGGSSCSDTLSAAFFNNPSNWGAGVGQIGPDSFVHLCGTFTGAANAHGILAVQGNGTAGHPVTIIFESGAKITAPYCDWSGNSSGCLVISTSGSPHSNIVVDGGIPCGWTWAGSEGGCNGTIVNTASGTGLTEHTSTNGIEMENCTNCEVRNLGIFNMYVQSGGSTNANPQNENAITFSGTNIILHDNAIHDCGSCLWYKGQNGDSSISALQNDIFNTIQPTNFSAGASGTASAALWHNNHFHDFTNWNTSMCTYLGEGFHAGGTGAVFNGLLLYNNLFGPNVGTCLAAHVRWSPNTGTAGSPALVNSGAVFNNVMVMDQAIGSYCTAISGNGNVLYNNTCLSTSATSAGQTGIDWANISQNMGYSFTFKNNAVQGPTTMVLDDVNGSSANVTADYNVYSQCPASGTTESNCLQAFVSGGTASNWGLYLANSYGQEQHSKNTGLFSGITCCTGTLGLNATTFVPTSTGSAVYQAATNLTSLCSGNMTPLCTDPAGHVRPTTGPWDAGAFLFPGGGTPTASTPTFSPVAGSYPGSIAVTISTASGGAIICWNTSGAPATNHAAGCATGTLYTGPITVSASQSVYAVAGGAGFFDSAVGSAAYTITGTSATVPGLTPGAGTYFSTQSVTASTPSPGAIMCFTIDGSTPITDGASGCTHGTLYTGAISVSSSETIKIVAGGTGYTDSSVAVAAYTITSVAATPTFSPPGGSYFTTQSVALATATPGAIICYTTNGTTPATNGTTGCTTGTLYSTAISVSMTETIKAVAGGTPFTDSSVGSATYTFAMSGCSYGLNGCVQYAQAPQDGSSGPVSFTLSGVGAGHEIIFMVQLFPADTYTVTSSLGLTYTKRLSTLLPFFCACTLDTWTAETGSFTGNETVTFTPTGSTTFTGPAEGFEYAGLLALSPYDDSNSYITPTAEGSGVFSTGNVTTTSNSDVMITFVGSPNKVAVIFTTDTTDGFHNTAPDYNTAGNTVLVPADKTLGAAGTYVGSWNVASGAWGGWIHALAFKSASGGGGSSTATQVGAFMVGP